MSTPLDAPVVKLYCGDVPRLRMPTGGDTAALQAAGEGVEFAEALAFLLTRPPPDLLPPVLYEHVVRDKVRHPLGIRYWGMEAAFQKDLEGKTPVELADTFGFTDHRERWRTSAGDAMETLRPTSRSVTRYCKAGRRLLHALGAWPWAVVEGGKLPQRWHDQPNFHEGFAHWHREASFEALDRLRAAVFWARGDHSFWRRCHGENVEVYERWLESAARNQGRKPSDGSSDWWHGQKQAPPALDP